MCPVLWQEVTDQGGTHKTQLDFLFLNRDCGQILEEVPTDSAGPPPYKAVQDVSRVSLLEETLVLQTLVEYVKLFYWSKGNQKEKGTKPSHCGSLPNNLNPSSALAEQDNNTNWLIVFFKSHFCSFFSLIATQVSFSFTCYCVWAAHRKSGAICFSCWFEYQPLV